MVSSVTGSYACTDYKADVLDNQNTLPSMRVQQGRGESPDVGRWGCANMNRLSRRLTGTGNASGQKEQASSR
jgi:hypothetical protein